VEKDGYNRGRNPGQKGQCEIGPFLCDFVLNQLFKDGNLPQLGDFQSKWAFYAGQMPAEVSNYSLNYSHLEYLCRG